jgi:hypothetical protein
MAFVLEDMEPIDIADYIKDKNGRVNPFSVDAFSMGNQISDDIWMMTYSHSDEPFKDCYFINTKTGERQTLKLKEK